jgi:N12 class adenine-specific DNA methylase/SAM-dependent methyltransferase
VFDEADARFAAVRRRLGELLDPTQMAAAARNTLNAHYTDAGLVQAIWAGLSELGFSGGKVLEPGCGSGGFIGFAPAGTQVVGVELDPTTAAITSALYPDAQVLAESFADTRIAEASFDAAVGNVPFGKLVLHDRVHNPSGHSIHNHFIVKTLHLVRPGGIVALLSSRYTFDARNPGARREMAELGDLLGAVRLPEGAHRRAAGTNVVTDLIILRRRLPGEPGRGAAFERTVVVDVDGGAVTINEYFAANPTHVLGELYCGRGVYGDDECLVRGRRDAAPDLAVALAGIAAAARAAGLTMAPAMLGPTVPAPVAALARRGAKPDGFIEIAGDGFTTRRHGVQVPYACPATQRSELAALLGIRDTMIALLEAEAASQEDTAANARLRDTLNQRYDHYVARWGPINRFAWRRTGRMNDDGVEIRARVRPPRGGFRSDPNASVLDALEIFDPEDGQASKAAIFSRRVIAPPPARLGADTPQDALAICMDNYGEVRLDEIARLLGTGSAQARSALESLVFDDPETSALVPAAAYLSGNVRAKLAAARSAAASDSRYLANVEALTAVLPVELRPGQIEARLGASWIADRYVADFLNDILDEQWVKVEHAGGAEWNVDGGRWGVLATSTWGTRRRSAGELVQSLLRQSEIRVDDVDGDGKHWPNLDETLAARDKAARLAERFSAWVWEDAVRADALAAAYNERFNCITLRSYDGASLALPGLALSFEPRPHQLAGVARMIAEPAVLLAHEVGAGKTAVMAMGCMELRRLGLAAKPALVVPNHMVEQFGREFLQCYPRARVLVGTKADLAGPEGRRRLVARCATGDWDAIIISHSTFERIPLSYEHRVEYMDRETQRIRAWLEGSRAGVGLAVKRLERALLRAQERIKSKLDTGKFDTGISFELTGIDYLAVDEAHLFKNLCTPSNIAGAAITGSQRAQDLDMKLDWLRRHNDGGRCVTFATATPIANSVTEAYVMQHYLQPALLEAAGIECFDTWAATFAETRTAVELDPDGTTYRTKSRFAKFVNVPELLRMLHVSADVKTAADLGLPTPALLGGAPETVVVPGSDELAGLVRTLGERAEAVRAGQVEPTEDNMLKISSDGRLAALDLRLVGRARPAGPTKLDVAAERIATIWAAHRDEHFVDAAGLAHPRPGALQLVFCDLGVPSSSPERWNAYDELRSQLVARGLPHGAVRFVHEARSDHDKEELFAACRAGSVAVLIGSTARMGIGTNVQARAIALHHLECPWRPAELTQRDGRIMRQGNQNPVVQIIRYVTEGSFDTYTWQTIERKAHFIGQLMRNRLDVREIDDIGDAELSYAEVKALAAGNPRLIEKAGLDTEATRLVRLERAWQLSQDSLARDAERFARDLASAQGELVIALEALSTRVATHGDQFAMTVDGHTYTARRPAGQALIDHLVAEADRPGHSRERVVERSAAPLGSIGGFGLAARAWRSADGRGASLELVGLPRSKIELTHADLAPPMASGVVSRLEKRVALIESLVSIIAGEVGQAKGELARAQAGLGESFPHASALLGVRQRSAALQAELDELGRPEAMPPAPGPAMTTTSQPRPTPRPSPRNIPARHPPPAHSPRRSARSPRGPRL